MEASQAGLGQGDGGAPAEGGAEQQSQQGPDFSQLAEQISSLSAGQEQLRDYLMQAPWQEQQQGQEDPSQGGEMDLSWLDPAEPGYDPEQVAQRLSGLVEQSIEQRLQPLQEQQAELRRSAEADRLVQEFPELAQENVATEVVQSARQLAEMHGHPELAAEPWFWRLTFMGIRAAEAHNSEGAETPQAAHLEGGSGAGPAGGQQVDWAQQIVNGGEGELGRRALPF